MFIMNIEAICANILNNISAFSSVYIAVDFHVEFDLREKRWIEDKLMMNEKKKIQELKYIV